MIRKKMREKEREKIKITIPGQPPRVTHQSGTRHTSHGNHTYKTPQLQAEELRLIKGLKPYVPAEKITGPVMLTVTYVFKPTAKKMRGQWKTTKPDTDNMIKTLKDVMTRMHFWTDDAQVAKESVSKVWDDEPGIHITIQELENE